MILWFPHDQGLCRVVLRCVCGFWISLCYYLGMFCHSSSGKAKTAKEEIENQTAWEDSEKNQHTGHTVETATLGWIDLV